MQCRVLLRYVPKIFSFSSQGEVREKKIKQQTVKHLDVTINQKSVIIRKPDRQLIVDPTSEERRKMYEYITAIKACKESKNTDTAIKIFGTVMERKWSIDILQLFHAMIEVLSHSKQLSMSYDLFTKMKPLDITHNSIKKKKKTIRTHMHNDVCVLFVAFFFFLNAKIFDGLYVNGERSLLLQNFEQLVSESEKEHKDENTKRKDRAIIYSVLDKVIQTYGETKELRTCEALLHKWLPRLHSDNDNNNNNNNNKSPPTPLEQTISYQSLFNRIVNAWMYVCVSQGNVSTAQQCLRQCVSKSPLYAGANVNTSSCLVYNDCQVFLLWHSFQSKSGDLTKESAIDLYQFCVHKERIFVYCFFFFFESKTMNDWIKKERHLRAVMSSICKSKYSIMRWQPTQMRKTGKLHLAFGKTWFATIFDRTMKR
ncbi:hypothetical protein RFI_04598 [Reticulomyxa filosa]|uniref:Uncharacterized protein n=1 Tax=Reticulomyxa filosa TaxID=46433 RepID=X6P2R3_RETFI|nr:hypothetical protein RFI_04598 [Reticulomyxa filosa]|eukprot:ETO32516.1 hypothetical protein RFI_04598 [Reticulomyxa filosa]